MAPSARTERRAPRWLLLIAVVLVLGSCRDRAAGPGVAATVAPDGGTVAEPGAAFPVTLRDDLGRTVTLRVEPRRIVALMPSHTETLFALGAGARVVGVDDLSDYPPEVSRLPKLGGLYDPHVEQILALSPDLVIASEAGQTHERLTALGLTVWAGSASRLDDVYRLVGVIGQLSGKGPAAAALSASMRREIEGVASRFRALPRVRVYQEIDPTPYTVGPGSFLGALLDKAGGDNVIPAGLGDFPRISPELVIAKDPEVILGVSLADAARRPGWAGITAVKRGAVDVLDPAEQSLVTRPGPRLAEGLSVLGRHLHRAPLPPAGEGGP
jgi:iron complex transport system substrate-binding protein